jgi:hypothetical protein
MYHLTRLWLIISLALSMAGFTTGWLAARNFYRRPR